MGMEDIPFPIEMIMVGAQKYQEMTKLNPMANV